MSTDKGDVYIFSFCAIPGVGKSTLLKQLQETDALKKYLPENVQIAIVQEPVDEWREKGWLQQFYEDPSQNAAAFQFLVFDSHVDAIASAIAAARRAAAPTTEAQEKTRANAANLPPTAVGLQVLLVERSFYCQRLFWQVQVDNGCKSANSFYNTAYTRLWEKWRKFVPEPSHLFYLHTSTLDETMKRVDQRDRAEEKQSGLTREYQAQLLAKHEAWYTEPVARPHGAPEEGVPCTHVCVDRVDEQTIEQIGIVICNTLAK